MKNSSNEIADRLRLDFPILHTKVKDYSLVYLDSAATSQKPKQVLQALTHFYEHDYGTVHRALYSLAERATMHYEQARTTVAHFIRAQYRSEIVFTKGATEGINFIASAWGRDHISQGDEIVLSELEHHSNLLPWQQLALRSGALLKFIPVTPEGVLDLSTLDKIITKRTKLVAIVHVSNALGTHNDIKTIAQVAQSVGARVLVDACQSVPYGPVDVLDLGADFLVFSGHKMLAPTGIGVLYIKKDVQHEVNPYQLGGGMVFEASYEQATWLESPWRYEAGTPPIAQAIGLAAAIDYINEYVDFTWLQAHQAALCTQLIEGLATLKGIRLLGPLEQLMQKGHLVSFMLEGYHPHDIAAYLDNFGICVRAGHYCAQPLARKLAIPSSVRISFYLYNTTQEVDKVLERLSTLVKK